MITAKCHIVDCTIITLGISGWCFSCDSNLCPTHKAAEIHACHALTASSITVQPRRLSTLIEMQEDERDDAAVARNRASLDRLYQRVKSSNLAELVEALREGQSGRVIFPHSFRDFFGHMNVHVPIVFDDGTSWLARISQQSLNAPSQETGKIIVASEVATMKAMRSKGLLVPDVLGPMELSLSQSDCTTAFALVKNLPGSPCDATLTRGDLSPTAMSTTIRDLASFYIGMSSLSFPSIGSLTTDKTNDSISVGPLISLPFCRNDPPYFFGPFHSASERYLAQIDWTINLIDDGKMFTDNAIHARLHFLEVRRIVVARMSFEEGDNGPFYIKHADDKGDQLLVDENGHLTGILDWEWAYTTCKEEAFAAPRSLIETKSFWEGSNELSKEETMFAQAFEDSGRPDLAACVRNGKFYQRLSIIIDEVPDFDMLKAFVHAGTGEVIESETMEDWVEVAKGRYADHEAVKRLLK